MAFRTSKKVPIYVYRTYFADFLSPRVFRWYLLGWDTLYAFTSLVTVPLQHSFFMSIRLYERILQP